jgi:hypothetical protein
MSGSISLNMHQQSAYCFTSLSLFLANEFGNFCVFYNHYTELRAPTM